MLSFPGMRTCAVVRPDHRRSPETAERASSLPEYQRAENRLSGRQTSRACHEEGGVS